MMAWKDRFLRLSARSRSLQALVFGKAPAQALHGPHALLLLQWPDFRLFGSDVRSHESHPLAIKAVFLPY